MKRYQIRAIEAAQVIGAHRAREGDARRSEARRGARLTSDELAFYDAREVSDTAVEVLGDETLRIIARELVDSVQQNVSIVGRTCR